MRRLLEEDLETNDVMALFESRLGFRLKEAAMETTAVAASGEAARRLDVPEGHPLLRVRSTPYDIEGTPICSAELLFCGDRSSYKWKVTR
ncbi:UTRA domain-containing protein [Cupriavidus necator]|uniref:UTRA domain-containing protein n=1 Tax=Cupriavidus necator TaxID=106590 RepID=UPI0039C1EDA0